MKAIIKTVSIAASVIMLTYSLPFNTFAVNTDDVTKGSFTYMPAFAEEAATEPYFYSDSYFADASDSVNTHLRTMSMALALSTMEVGGSSYVTDLLGDIGFEDIAIGDMNEKPTKDTIGTAIGHKNVDGQEIVAVAIRGSKYDSEWASNLTAGVDGDIKGFSDASKKVNDRIKDYLADNELTDVKLWITGYSRAGAVADLTAVYINEHTAEFETSADDVFFGIFDHNSDKMYEKLTNDLKVILTDMYNAEKTKGNDGLSEKDFNAVLDSLYPLFRQLGPAVVKDMHYHIGMNTDDFLPEDFNDPDYEPGYYEEEEEEPEPVTEAEKGAADGKSAAWVGYNDGLNGEKYASYNDVPDDGEEHTPEYLEAYKQAYKEEYEIQYAAGLKDCKTDYQKGIDDGEYRGEQAAAQDMENENEYGTSYNDEPEVNEDSAPYSEEYIQGYKEGYKKGYDIKFKERPLYHVATFALNFDELSSEHQPQYNWELVKSLDNYYTEDTSEPDSSSVPDSSSSASSSSKAQSSSQAANSTKTDTNPATGNAALPMIALIVTAGIAVISEKKK